MNSARLRRFPICFWSEKQIDDCLSSLRWEKFGNTLFAWPLGLAQLRVVGTVSHRFAS